MKTRTKLLTGIIAILLSCVLLFTCVVLSNNTNNSQVSANSRTIELSQSAVDAQSVLNEFDDATLTREGSTVYFEGYKPIDKNVLTEIDYISETDFEELENCTTKYNFSYNSETNIVTIAATATLADGTVEVDEISGVGFINDKDEIDAVMNIDGEGILLSEMRDAGMIQNCGWFASLIKKVAIAVAVVATVVAVAAVVVATAGAAAPALVATGVGIATAVSAGTAAAAATIATYAAITAAISAGVALTSELWEQYYPGINVSINTSISGTKTFVADWSKTETQTAIKDIIISERKKTSPKIYFRVTKYNQVTGPTKVELIGYTATEMAVNMASFSWSSLTFSGTKAISVLQLAFPGYQLSPLHIKGMKHYHMLYPGSQTEVKGANGAYIVHSFFSELLAV